jgi:hypothetical protein
MKTSHIAIWTLPLLAAGTIALSGCGKRSNANPTTITYSQIGACKTWTSQAGMEAKAKPNEIYAIFKIETVDNTKPSDIFTFDPQRLYVNQMRTGFGAANDRPAGDFWPQPLSLAPASRSPRLRDPPCCFGRMSLPGQFKLCTACPAQVRSEQNQTSKVILARVAAKRRNSTGRQSGRSIQRGPRQANSR